MARMGYVPIREEWLTTQQGKVLAVGYTLAPERASTVVHVLADGEAELKLAPPQVTRPVRPLGLEAIRTTLKNDLDGPVERQSRKLAPIEVAKVGLNALRSSWRSRRRSMRISSAAVSSPAPNFSSSASAMEARLRRAAKRQGYLLRRSRRPVGPFNLGKFQVFDPGLNTVAHGYWFELDLEDISKWLGGTATMPTRRRSNPVSRLIRMLTAH